MVFDPREFVIRRPRHNAEGAAPCRIWLEAIADFPVESQDVQLLDFSRRGAKVELQSPIPPKAVAVVHITDESLGLDVAIRGQVQWQRTAGVGRWLLGCHFDEPVSYEVIGELFLSGVLSTGTPSA